jgi:hypothetical protein
MTAKKARSSLTILVPLSKGGLINRMDSVHWTLIVQNKEKYISINSQICKFDDKVNHKYKENS